MSEALAQELAVRRIVQPPRCATWMRKRDERHPALHSHAADGAFEWHLSPEPLDRETSDEEDHAGLQKRQLLLEPWCAERDLRWRRPAIAASGSRLPWEALGDRRAIRKMVLVDPRLRQPAPQLRAGATAERLSGRQLDLAWCLADDRDAIADRSGHDRLRALQESRVDAFRAGPDAAVKSGEGACAIDQCSWWLWRCV